MRGRVKAARPQLNPSGRLEASAILSGATSWASAMRIEFEAIIPRPPNMSQM